MILNILKIVLIVIVVLFILVFLLLLFNIDYQVLIKKQKNAKIYISLSYLFGLIRFKGVYNKKFIYNMKILFIKKSNNKLLKEKNELVNKYELKNIPEDNYIFYDKEYILSDKKDVKELIEDSKKYNHNSIKVKNGKNVIFNNIKDVIKDKKTLSLIIESIKKVLDIIAPKELKGEICYGILNPFYVGILFGLTGILKSLSNNNLKFKPIFGVYKLSCDVEIKGKISVIKLVFVLLKLYLNKNLRKLVFN